MSGELQQRPSGDINLDRVPAQIAEQISPETPKPTYIESPPATFDMHPDQSVCEQSAKQTLFEQLSQSASLERIHSFHGALADAVWETWRPLFQLKSPLENQLTYWQGEETRLLGEQGKIRRENSYSFAYRWDTSNISFIMILFLLYAAVQSMLFGILGVQNTLVTNVVAFMDSPGRAIIWSMIFIVFPFIYKGAYASEPDEQRKEAFVKFFLRLFTVNLALFLFLFSYQYAPDPAGESLSLGLTTTAPDTTWFTDMIPVLGLLSQLVLELTGSVLTLIYFQKMEAKYRVKKQVRTENSSPALKQKSREIAQVQHLVFVLQRDIGSIESMKAQFDFEKAKLIQEAENAFYYYLRAI